jgi:hypothetical protein
MRIRMLSVVFCFTMILLTQATAQINKGFVATKSIFAGGNPTASAIADLNHDGIPDIVVADGLTTTVDPSGAFHQTVAGIAVLLGKGDGSFRPVSHYSTSHWATFVCVADVNGEGHPDISRPELHIPRSTVKGRMTLPYSDCL